MKYLNYLKHVILNVLYRPVDFLARRDSKFSLLLIFISSAVIKSYMQLRLLPVEWLDENKNEVKKTLEQEELSYSYGPKDIGGAQCVEPVQLPAVNLYLFENARVSVLSSSILLDNKIIIERVEGVEAKRCNYSTGHVFMHGQKSALVRNLQTEHLEQGIFLGGNGSFNYYHWMIEIIPKLMYLNELDKHGYEGFPLLVSEDVDHIKTFREALNYIVKDRPVVMLSKDKAYCVGKLVYINAPNNLPFNLRRNEKMRISDFLTRISSINFLRNRLSLSVDFPPPANGSHRIFFARRNERRNYNQQETFEIFRQQGFQKVFMEELSLKEQISLISNAEVIAGPTGAAWTNLIFCREGAKCLCWMAEGYGEFSAFSNLARVVGADMRYVTFKTDAKSVGELYGRNYSLDAKKLRQGLATLLGAAA
jgi:hypothetical protein